MQALTVYSIACKYLQQPPKVSLFYSAYCAFLFVFEMTHSDEPAGMSEVGLSRKIHHYP